MEDQGEGKRERELGRKRDAKLERLLNIENETRVEGRGGGERWAVVLEVGTYGEEHWVLYGNQFDNKLLKIKLN